MEMGMTAWHEMEMEVMIMSGVRWKDPEPDWVGAVAWEASG